MSVALSDCGIQTDLQADVCINNKRTSTSQTYNDHCVFAVDIWQLSKTRNTRIRYSVVVGLAVHLHETAKHLKVVATTKLTVNECRNEVIVE
jgi:hypothetical protein